MMPDPALVLAAVGAVVVHRRGLRRGDVGVPVAWRGAGLPLGAAVVLLALTPAVESLAEASFAWHMVQHQLLVLVAGPLLATSAPVAGLWLGTVGRRPPRLPVDAATRVLLAGVASVAGLVLWHVPAAYDAAIADPRLHLLEHVTLLTSAVLLWSAVIRAAADDRRLPAAVLALAGTAIAGAALGVVLLTAPEPLYGAYAAGGAAALDQQRVGGALMKVGALLVHAGAAVGFTLRWLHRLEDRPASVAR